MHPAFVLLRSSIGKHLIGVLGIAVALGAVYYLVYRSGYNAAVRDQQAIMVESLNRGLEQARDIARQDAEITEYYENWRTRYVAQLQTSVAEVGKHVEPDCLRCGLWPDGLRALNTIRQPKLYAPHSSQPDSGMSGSPAPYDGVMPRSNRSISPGQPSVSRMRYETQSSGQCREGTGGA